MNTPTKITLVRICLIPIFVAVFLIDAIPYGKFIALAVFAVASATDWLDGHLARKYNQVTDLGKFLDTTADKLLVTAAMILILLPSKDSVFLIPLVVMAVVIISRELIMLGFRALAASKGTVLSSGWLGKIKAALQMVALIILIPCADIVPLSATVADIVFYIGFGLLGVAALLGIISMIEYLVRNREVFK